MKKSIILRGSLSYDNHPQSFLSNIVNTIRTWFDGEIIISTWEGQEHNISTSLGIDKIVLTKDPGPGPIQHWKRQVVSAIEGFNASTGDLVLISRPDMLFEKDIFQFIDTEELYNKLYNQMF